MSSGCSGTRMISGWPYAVPERDVAGVPAHDFDDRDAAMALGGGADAFDALRRDEHRRGIAGRGVVDDVIEIEDGVATRVRL